MIQTMQQTELTDPLNRVEPDGAIAALRVVIAYEDIEAGKRAMRIFDHLSQDHQNEIEFEPQPWKFDFLGDPDFFQTALLDGRKADIVVIAMTESENLPTVVREWVSACFRDRRRHGGAVIALFGLEGQQFEAEPSSLEFLRSEARKAGLTLLEPSRNTASPRPRSKSDLRGTWQTTPRNTAPFGRHWGINE